MADVPAEREGVEHFVEPEPPGVWVRSAQGEDDCAGDVEHTAAHDECEHQHSTVLDDRGSKEDRADAEQDVRRGEHPPRCLDPQQSREDADGCGDPGCRHHDCARPAGDD